MSCHSCLLCRELLATQNITDFYTKMIELGEKLHLSQLLPYSDFIKVRTHSSMIQCLV